MISKMNMEDVPEVMNIWLETNIRAHSFIKHEYWKENFEMVSNILPKAEVYVYKQEEKVVAFVGIDSGYIAGIFVNDTMQSKGIGRILLDKCKELYSELSLNVYKNNEGAVKFYLREGFKIQKAQIDENTQQEEYYMTWQK